MISSLKQKDALALKDIHLRYKKRLVYFAYKILEDDEWAEDFAGDALMKLWEKYDCFNSEDEIKNFLYQTVRDSCLGYLRVYKPGKKFTDDEIQKFRYKA